MTQTTGQRLFIRRFLATLLALSPVMASAQNSLCREMFDAGDNEHGFDFGVPSIEVRSEGGATGGFFHVENLITFLPSVNSTAKDSCFVGNLFAQNAAQLSASFKIFYTEYAEQMVSVPVSLIVDATVNGQAVSYYTRSTVEVSATSQEWQKVDFKLPTDASEWPADWKLFPTNPESPSTSPRNVFENVSNVDFYFGDVELMTILRYWEVGFDDVELTSR